MNRPQRAFAKRLRPIGRATVGESIDALVADLCQRIRNVRNITQAGTYVLADCEGQVYVLREQAATTAAMVREYADWLVGCYAAEWERPTFPDAERMRIDLVSALFRVGFLNAAAIYGQIEHESSPDH